MHAQRTTHNANQMNEHDLRIKGGIPILIMPSDCLVLTDNFYYNC